MGQRDEKNKKKLFTPALWPKPVYQGTDDINIFSVHITLFSINPENSKASPKKRQVIKSAVIETRIYTQTLPCQIRRLGLSKAAFAMKLHCIFKVNTDFKQI